MCAYSLTKKIINQQSTHCNLILRYTRVDNNLVKNNENIIGETIFCYSKRLRL